MKRCQALLFNYLFSFPLPLFSWGFHAMRNPVFFRARVPLELPPTYRIRSTSTDLRPLHACYSLFSGAYHCERKEQHWIEIQYQEKWTPGSCYLFLFFFSFFLVQFTPQPTQRYSILDTQKKKIGPPPLLVLWAAWRTGAQRFSSFGWLRLVGVTCFT
jgi:hypothetical protein